MTIYGTTLIQYRDKFAEYYFESSKSFYRTPYCGHK